MKYIADRKQKVFVAALVLFLGMATLALAEQENTITLSQALERATADNHAIRAAAARLDQAKYAVWIARSANYPSVVASGSYTRYENPTFITPIHEVGVFPALDDEIYEGSVKVNVPLLDPKSVAEVRTAKTGVALGNASVDALRIRIVSAVTQLFLHSEQLHDNRRLLQAHLDALSERMQEIEALLGEGRVSEADAAEIDSRMNDVRSDLLETERQIEALASELGNLIGAQGNVTPTRTTFSPVPLPAQSEHRSGDPPAEGPNERIARLNLQKAEGRKDAVRWSFLPSVSGFAATNLRSGTPLDVSSEWSAGFSVRLALVTGGSRIASLKAAEAEITAARQEYVSAQQYEDRAARLARDRWQVTQERRQLMLKAVQEKSRAAGAAAQRYREGRTSLSTVLTEEADLLELRIKERALAYQQISAFTDYHAARGDLTAELITLFRKE